MTPACAHGMPSVASCGVCMMEGPPPPRTLPEPQTAVRTMEARHAGECPECDHTISEGDVIGLVPGRDPEDDAQWVCERCWA